MWDDFWESILPASANLTKVGVKFTRLSSGNWPLEPLKVFGHVMRSSERWLVTVSGYKWPVKVCCLDWSTAAVDVGSWTQQCHEKRKNQSTLKGFFSLMRGKHVHTPLSAARSGHTMWCYSKFSTLLMVRNKGFWHFCSFGPHPQHPPPHTHQPNSPAICISPWYHTLYFTLRKGSLLTSLAFLWHILNTYLQLISPQNQMKWVILHKIKPFFFFRVN